MRSTIHGVRSIADQILGFADFLARRVRRSRREVWIFLTTNKWPARKGRPWSEATRIQREKWITNRWLEFKFSVVPTLMDIEQSGQALSWLLFDEGRPARFTEKAGASESWTGTWVSPWPTNGAFPGNLGASHTSLEAEARVHFSLVYDLVPTNLTTFQQLGLTNLAGVVWELTTFSWMVDYVLGVGDWVNSMVSLDGLRFVEGSESRIMTVKTAPVPIQIQPHPQNRVSGFSGVIPEAEAGRFQRVVLSELPAPALLPSARNKLGLSQLANVLAVIANVASAR
jgi:hypothetical protein